MAMAEFGGEFAIGSSRASSHYRSHSHCGGKRCSDSGWHDQAKAIAQRASVRPCRVYGNQAAMLPSFGEIF